MTSADGISVVVRTFNSAKTLDLALWAMQLADEDECIIVDSGSTDATLKIAAKHHAAIIAAPRPFNYSKSLNLGFQAARNAWVLVISSHCIPVVSHFMEILRREVALFYPDVVVGYAPSTVSGKSDPKLDSERTAYYGSQEYRKMKRVCGNGNTIYRRSAWEELSFDENIRTAEDKLWIEEMLRRNCRFAYIPAARGLNKNQASLAYMFRKGHRDARATREAGHRPMFPWQLAGALKGMARQKGRGEIDWGNWARYSAHILGQFFGSYRSEDNTPKGGAS